MAMVSRGEAWGGRDTQVSLAESMGTLPGSISCRTNGVLEAQKSHHEPVFLVGLSILQAKSQKSTNGRPLQRKGDPGPTAHILLSCLTPLLSTQPLSTQRATPSLPIRHVHTLWTPGPWD